MPRTSHTLLPQTIDAARILGLQVAAARRGRRMPISELAERAGIDPKTLRKVERGDPTVSLGIAFEVAALAGVDLFGVDPEQLPSIVRRETDRVALLPARIVTRAVDDDF